MLSIALVSRHSNLSMPMQTPIRPESRVASAHLSHPSLRGWINAAAAIAVALTALSPFTAHAACGFNIDRLSVNDPSLASGEFTSDGLLIVRALQNLTGTSLIAGTRVDQTPANQASVVATIQNHMTTYRASHDMDASGVTDINDGIIIARYLAGYRGDSLVQGLTLSGTRAAGSAIESYIAGGCTTPSLPLTWVVSSLKRNKTH